MQLPVLVTAPTVPVVDLPELKAHLRVDHDDDDGLIASLEASAVAHMDGWRGILGRAIMPQTWSQEFDGTGRCDISMPDVSNVRSVGVVDGIEDPLTSVVLEKRLGQFVAAWGSGADYYRITYDVALPVEQLPAVQMAVKLLVGHWYENREGVTERSLKAAPMAVEALLAPLRVMTV